jgi:DNA primase
MSKYSNLKDFIDYELYPYLFENIDRAFPDMEFKRKGNKWISPYHLDGSRSNSADQTFMTSAMKHYIKDNGGDGRTLIDFEIKRTGADFITALKRLAEVCHLELPNSDTEEYKEYKKRQEYREQANKKFISSLWSGTPEANEVLNYLRSRKWTDEDIKKGELGYIDGTILASLPNKEDYSFTTPKGDAIGASHRLTIPYRNGSRLFGFKFRNISYSQEDKDKGRTKYLNSKGLTKGGGLFGIGIGYKEQEDITIVEGELDALHAKVRGATNIVATTGGSIGEGQAEEAIKRGVRRFTLLFDNDERGKSFIESSIRVLEPLHVSIHIASLPDKVKDTDEYLETHSIEEWEEEVKHSIPVCLWRFYKCKDKYKALWEEQGEGENATYKQIEDFLYKEVEEIVNAPNTLPHERELVFNELQLISPELSNEFKAYMNRAYIRRQDKQREDDTKKASAQIESLLKDNRIDDALKVMEETTRKQGAKDKATEFASIFAPSTPNEYYNLLSEVKDGLPTGIVFEGKGQREELTLNSGLTFICAYRGHGKTSFLNNIALNEVGRNIALENDKKVLYFSYEVDKRRLIADLLNTYVNDTRISQNPLKTILSYFKGKGYTMFADHKSGGLRREDGTTTIQHFETSKERFFREFLSSGRLCVVEENYKVGKLLDAIKYYISINPVSLVCIDYAQLIYSEDYSRQRTEEIKAIVNDIKDFANKEGIPFVLACQFNREVESPVSVDTKNIGEGGDFERIADTCIGLFNLKELHPLPKNNGEEREAKKLLGSLGVDTSDSLKPIQGKLFVRLLKRRYGYYPLDTILEWEGRTKKITLNAPELLKVEHQQTELDLYDTGEEDTPF